MDINSTNRFNALEITSLVCLYLVLGALQTLLVWLDYGLTPTFFVLAVGALFSPLLSGFLIAVLLFLFALFVGGLTILFNGIR